MEGGAPTGPVGRGVARILERVRLIGLARGLRGVEQTPETSHVLREALEAYPQAQAVHAVRDGRDVVCSLLERGWLNAGRTEATTQGSPTARSLASGSSPSGARSSRRFPTRAAAHGPGGATSRRCARRVPAIGSSRSATRLPSSADALAGFLDANVTSAHRALDGFRDTSIGRWRKELTPEQVADVEAEAGPLLAELGYA